MLTYLCICQHELLPESCLGNNGGVLSLVNFSMRLCMNIFHMRLISSVCLGWHYVKSTNLETTSCLEPPHHLIHHLPLASNHHQEYIK